MRSSDADRTRGGLIRRHFLKGASFLLVLALYVAAKRCEREERIRAEWDRLTRSSSDQDRIDGAGIIGALAPEGRDGVPRLIELLSDRSDDVAHEAIRALARYPGDLLVNADAVMAVFDGRDDKFREVACTALLEVGRRDPQILRWLVDGASLDDGERAINSLNTLATVAESARPESARLMHLLKRRLPRTPEGLIGAARDDSLAVTAATLRVLFAIDRNQPGLMDQATMSLQLTMEAVADLQSKVDGISAQLSNGSADGSSREQVFKRGVELQGTRDAVARWRDLLRNLLGK
jgi:hypothetical protein